MFMRVNSLLAPFLVSLIFFPNLLHLTIQKPRLTFMLITWSTKYSNWKQLTAFIWFGAYGKKTAENIDPL